MTTVTRKLQYSAAHNAGSWAIRYWSAGYWSHVDTVLPANTMIEGKLLAGEWLLGARSDVLKGIPAGFEARPPNYEEWSAIAIVELEMTEEQGEKFDAFERAQLHKPYDGPGIVGFVLPSLVPARNETWREPNAWFCSEEKQAALESCGWMPSLNFPENRVTPIASYLMTLAKGGKVIKSLGVPRGQ